ncbi:MAG: leucine-rich repeat protein [Clostridia bacterium]|nr:leucine-rich repeat protein [Clostridia bacterium]
MNKWMRRWLTVALTLGMLLNGMAFAEGLIVEDEDADAIVFEMPAEEAVEAIALDLPGETAQADTLSQAQAIQSNASDSDFVIENGVVVAYNGPGGNVTVPEGVTAIGEDAFAYNTSITHVTLPDGLRIIGEGSFTWAENLKSLTVPDGVQSIGRAAFEGCMSMTEIIIPASVTTIGMGNFVYWDDDDDGLNVLPKLTVFGYKGSRAETYARKAYADADPGDFVYGASRIIPFRAFLDAATVTVADQSYTGKALKPDVKVTLGEATLVKGKDYKVAYKQNKKVGTATVTVKGIGAYAGSAAGAFNINPKKVSGLKLTAGKQQLTVQWKKTAGVAGYQVAYGLKKSFANAKEATVKKDATVKKVLKGLKSRKTYYVRVRAWQKVNGKTYWSNWSAVKKLKVK